MYSRTQPRSGRLGANTLSPLCTALKRTRWSAVFGLLVAMSACDLSTAPEQVAVSHEAPVGASISFGRLATDNEVITFLSRHNISATAVYMYSAGLHGTDHLPAGLDAATVVAQARVHAEEDARSGMEAARSELATVMRDEPEASVSEQRRLVATFQTQQKLEHQSQGNAPLIWGLEIRGSEHDVGSALADVLVKDSEASVLIAEQVRVRKVAPPMEFATADREIAQPSDAEIRSLAGALVRSAASDGMRSIRAAAAPAGGSYYPNSGKIIYTGDKYFAAQFRWDKPAFSNVRGVGVEIDLQISIERGWPFVYNPGSAPCTTWTDLPRPYDDCPTAGIDDDAGWVTYSLGSYDARAIQAGKIYLGSWTFRGAQMGAYWAMRMRGQEVYNKLCPSLTGRGYSPWCMFVYNGRSRDLTAGVITWGRRWTYSW